MTINKIGYGTWGIGGRDYGPISENRAKLLLDYAIKKNIKLFDTAPLYGDGKSEKYIGEILKKKRRSDIIISTKCGMLPHVGFDLKQDFSLKNLFNDLINSLERMNTGYIDYYLLHSPDIKKINLKKIFSFFQDIKTEGLIKNFGISLRSPKDLLHSLKEKIKIDIVEFNFNLFDQRGIDIDIFKILKKNKIKSICRTPLCFGFLSGNIIKKNSLDKRDHRRRFWSAKQFLSWSESRNLFDKFYKKYKYQDYSQFALNFCLSHPFDYVIPGMMSKKDIDLNIKASMYPRYKNEDLKKIYFSYKKNENKIFITKK